MDKYQYRKSRFRDFIYDVSDILVAIAIILAAAALISWRVSAILNYSYDCSSSSDRISITRFFDSSADSEAQSASESSKSDSEKNASAADEKKEAASGSGSIYEIIVTAGETPSDIAGVLKEAGLISDEKAFTDAVADAGAQSSIKAGTYKIKSGSTPAEIVTSLTS